MSLYNALFGKNPMSLILLKMLNLTEKDCGRFRDAYLHDDKIIVYTRNGGDNRGHWDFIYEEYDEGENCPCAGCVMDYRLPNHPNYICDYDDDFDCTYAYIEFSIPDEYKELLKEVANNQLSPETISEKFQHLIDSLQN